MSLSVGVDIGATAVRVAGIAGVDADGYARVRRFGAAPLKRDAVIAGQIKNPQQVAAALNRALREAKVAPYGFILGLASPNTALLRVPLPHAIRRHERVGSLRSMAQSGRFDLPPYVPAQTAALAAQLIREGTDTTLDTIAVAAAQDDDLTALREVCKIARCEPKAVDLAGAGTVRALVRCPAEDTEIAAIVDIGATNLTVATRQGPYLRSLRTALGGGEALTRAIVSVSEEDLDEAEKRKLRMRIGSRLAGIAEAASGYLDDDDVHDDAQHTIIEDALNQAADNLIENIAGAVDADAITHNDNYARSVLLCGATARMPGLKERLARRLNIPVQIGRPWAHLIASKHTAAHTGPHGDDAALMLSLTTAIGLALWKDPA